jgi:hypothetical protein
LRGKGKEAMMADSLETRLREIEREIAKGAKVGRLPKPVVQTAGELEAAVRRVFAARPSHEMARAITELTQARAMAKAAWERVRISGVELGKGTAAEKFARAGGAAATVPQPLGTQTGGLQVLFDWVRRLPHTYRTKEGRHCLTDRWISDGFLVYQPEFEPPPLGSIDNPWFGLNGPKFRCYYPASSMADWESCMTSGSSGRWLNLWSQKSNYIRF